MVASIKNVNLWWGTSFKGGEFRLSILRAQEIDHAKLRTIGNLWSSNDGGFGSWDEINDRFGLDPNEQCIRKRVLKSIPTIC
jgi:hypothetical protein